MRVSCQVVPPSLANQGTNAGIEIWRVAILIVNQDIVREGTTLSLPEGTRSIIYAGPKVSREPGILKKYKLFTVLDKARGAREKKREGSRNLVLKPLWGRVNWFILCPENGRAWCCFILNAHWQDGGRWTVRGLDLGEGSLGGGWCNNAHDVWYGPNFTALIVRTDVSS